MSKILKHTFEIPNLTVENGELVEHEPTKVTYTFTLLFKGVGLFEEIHGKPLLTALASSLSGSDEIDKATNLIDKKFVKDLACASYVKIDGNKFHNNRATVEEFKKTQVYGIIENDVGFLTELLEMTVECVGNDEKAKLKSQGARPPKK
jgi:hypothetical protein